MTTVLQNDKQKSMKQIKTHSTSFENIRLPYMMRFDFYMTQLINVLNKKDLVGLKNNKNNNNPAEDNIPRNEQIIVSIEDETD